MNIFVTSFNPRLCAEYLDDKRVIKMILESTQLLSTALTLSGGQGVYKVTHKNHPCSIWVRQSRGNYLWLTRHMYYLCVEYEKRFNKIHSCYKHLDYLYKQSYYIPEGKLTPFVNCTPYKDLGVFIAYRLTLIEKWYKDKRVPTWYKKRVKDGI